MMFTEQNDSLNLRGLHTLEISGIPKQISQEQIKRGLRIYFGNIDSFQFLSNNTVVISLELDHEEALEFKKNEDCSIQSKELNNFSFKFVENRQNSLKVKNYGNDDKKQQQQKNTRNYILAIVGIIAIVLISYYLIPRETLNGLNMVKEEEKNINHQLFAETNSPIETLKAPNADAQPSAQSQAAENDKEAQISNQESDDQSNLDLKTAEQQARSKNLLNKNQKNNKKSTEDPNAFKFQEQREEKLKEEEDQKIWVSFELNQKKFKAIKKTIHSAKPVSNEEKQLLPAKVEILRFPVNRWMENKNSNLNFILSDAERNALIGYLGENPVTKKFDTSFFYKSLMNQPNAIKNYQAEYQYLDKLYQFDDASQQRPICVIAEAHSLYSKNKHIKFIHSLHQQNYTNYQVYYIDDDSSDYSAQQIFALVDTKYPLLRSKLTILKKGRERGSGIKDLTIKTFCSENSIIVDFNAESSFIGRQVFKVINALYNQYGDNWLMTSNYLSTVSENKVTVGMGYEYEGATTDYRQSDEKPSETPLVIYRAQLYNKIPLQYLTSAPDGKKKNRSYISNQNDAIMYALIELAGANRIINIPEMLCHKIDEPKQYSNCELALQQYDLAKIKSLAPLKPLLHFNDKATPLAGAPIDKQKLKVAKSNFEQKCQGNSLNQI